MLEQPAEYHDGFLSVENLEFIQEMDLLHCNVGLQTHPDGRIWVCVNGVAFLRFKPKPRAICGVCGDFIDQNPPHGRQYCEDRI